MALIDRYLGGILGILGLVCLNEAREVWSGWDGTGLMLLLVGGILLVLMFAYVFFPSRSGVQVKWFNKGETLQIAVVAASFALYVALMNQLGYVFSTWLFLAGITGYISPRRFSITLIWTGAVAIGTYIIFKHYLGMYLPVGLMRI